MTPIVLSRRLHSAYLRHRPAELARVIWRASTSPGSSNPLAARSMLSQGSEDAKVAQKAEMRKHIKAALKQTSQEEMATQSAAIAGHVLAAPFFAEAKAAAVYLTAPRLREVDTSEIVGAMLPQNGSSSKRCYVPVVVDQSSNMSFLHIDSMESLVEMPPFGIMEPTQHHADGSPRQNVLEHEEPLDIILMPGLGFDRGGGRLGRGGGYYDKFLCDMMQRASSKGWDPPLLVALAFRQQVVDEVPMTGMDQRIDFLVTPEGIHDCSRRSA